MTVTFEADWKQGGNWKIRELLFIHLFICFKVPKWENIQNYVSKNSKELDKQKSHEKFYQQ